MPPQWNNATRIPFSLRAARACLSVTSSLVRPDVCG